MLSEHWLSISLLLALCSNALLLILLTCNVLHNDNSPGGQPQQTNTATPGYHRHLESQTVELCENLFKLFSDDSNQVLSDNMLGTSDVTSDQDEMQKSLWFQSKDSISFPKTHESQEKTKASVHDFLESIIGSQNKRTGLFLFLYKQLTDIDFKLHLLRNSWGQNNYHKDAQRPSGDETHKSADRTDNEQLSHRGKFLNSIVSSVKERGRQNVRLQSLLRKRRSKRDTALLDLEAGPDGDYLNYEFQFAKFKDNETQAFSSPVSNILIPGLMKFEGRMIRHLEELHFSMVSHDLRLERVERAVLNLAKGRIPDSSSSKRRGDQRLEPISSEELIKLADGVDEFLPFSDTNDTGLQDNVTMEELDGDSSGDIDHNITLAGSTTTTSTTSSSTTTSTTTTRPPTPPTAFYHMQRDLQEIQHKVLALENYNTMSDSELTRARSEVMRMDDKVIEMQRIQKNANSVMGQHTYKINEIEMVANRNSMALTTTMDAYGRMNFRVEEFKDRLADFERDMHGVTTHFSKHEQISNELRSADSYKAHDIMEIRKSMVNVETRINEMYNVVDQRLEGVQTDIFSWFDRLCFNNDLIC